MITQDSILKLSWKWYKPPKMGNQHWNDNGLLDMTKEAS